MKKVLYGISGIGSGHTYRQLPIISHFAEHDQVVLFAYGESHRFYSRHFEGRKNVSVVKIDIPFIVGDKNGLNFELTARHPANQGKDFLKINSEAMVRAENLIGKPDLTITDYEPLSAAYSYAHNSTLVTLDQQSKYLCGDFPPELNGQGYADEVMRLMMFFPRADARIACSFFDVKKKTIRNADVSIVPPPLKEGIINLRRSPAIGRSSVLTYISAQRDFVQSLDEIVDELGRIEDTDFQVFARNVTKTSEGLPKNVRVYEHGEPAFYSALASCNAIVSTAGHTLLSEAMHLGIPVYAMPLAVYEQQMNAKVISQHGFGELHERVGKKELSWFIRGIPEYKRNIQEDRAVLLRGPGQKAILRKIYEAMNAQ